MQETSVTPDPRTGPYAVGIDVGGTKVAYGLYDGRNQLVDQRRHPTDSSLGPEAFFDRMIDAMAGLLAGNGLGFDELAGVGIGMPSFVLHDEGRIVTTAFLEHIKDFKARDYMQSRLGGKIQVVLANDAQVSALAEHRHGAGRGFSHMLYCPLSTGLASGMIIHGELFQGSYGWCGESGHMIATPGMGELCGCGNRGCFVSYCSGGMIVRHVRRWIEEGAPTVMTSYLAGGEPLKAEHVLRGCRENDALALRALDQMGHYLGVWCFNLYVTLNINCFVFGGGLVHFGDRLFSRIRAAFDSFNHNDFPVHFKLAELGSECGLLGAMELVRKTMGKDACRTASGESPSGESPQ